MTVTIISIYPFLITLALIVGVLWLFAVPRMERNRRLIALGIAFISITLAVENAYYFAARIMSEEMFMEMSYWTFPVGLMKALYTTGLVSVLIGFGGEK